VIAQTGGLGVGETLGQVGTPVADRIGGVAAAELQVAARNALQNKRCIICADLMFLHQLDSAMRVSSTEEQETAWLTLPMHPYTGDALEDAWPTRRRH
jgi:hypothetical protein